MRSKREGCFNRRVTSANVFVGQIQIGFFPSILHSFSSSYIGHSRSQEKSEKAIRKLANHKSRPRLVPPKELYVFLTGSAKVSRNLSASGQDSAPLHFFLFFFIEILSPCLPVSPASQDMLISDIQSVGTLSSIHIVERLNSVNLSLCITFFQETFKNICGKLLWA